jgi:hypothetical protein
MAAKSKQPNGSDGVPAPEPNENAEATLRPLDVERSATSGGSGKEHRLGPYQFKKGQSGNPKGRPKKSGIDLHKRFDELCRNMVPVVVAGRRLRMSNDDLVFRRFIEKATTGDMKAIRDYLGLRLPASERIFAGHNVKIQDMTTKQLEQFMRRLGEIEKIEESEE